MRGCAPYLLVIGALIAAGALLAGALPGAAWVVAIPVLVTAWLGWHRFPGPTVQSVERDLERATSRWTKPEIRRSYPKVIDAGLEDQILSRHGYRLVSHGAGTYNEQRLRPGRNIEYTSVTVLYRKRSSDAPEAGGDGEPVS